MVQYSVHFFIELIRFDSILLTVSIRKKPTIPKNFEIRQGSHKVLCNETMFLGYISSYLFPHSIDLSNSFCIVFLLSYYSCFNKFICICIDWNKTRSYLHSIYNIPCHLCPSRRRQMKRNRT